METLGNGLMEALGSTPTGAVASLIILEKLKTKYSSMLEELENGMMLKVIFTIYILSVKSSQVCNGFKSEFLTKYRSFLKVLHYS